MVPTGSEAWRSSIAQPILYSTAPSFSQLADLMKQDVPEEGERQWEASLRRSVETIGGLTAVDGASIINDQYEVLAFGAKIRRPPGSLPVDKWVITEPIMESADGYNRKARPSRHRCNRRKHCICSQHRNRRNFAHLPHH